MTDLFEITVTNQNLRVALNGFLKKVLQADGIGGVLAPMRLTAKQRVMPALITDVHCLDDADLPAPVFPINSARLVSRLTRKPLGAKIAVVMRPCEIRAFVELVKLKQGRMDDLVIIGMDCLGALNREAQAAILENGAGEAERFYRQSLWEGIADEKEIPLAEACRMCIAPAPEGADMALHLFGMAPDDPIRVQAATTNGRELINRLRLPITTVSPKRQAALKALVDRRRATAERVSAEVESATRTPDGLRAYLADCVNCYNCRVACPVCYCRECIFVTDVFDHEPMQYMEWATRKGTLQLPTDTLFYHLTRMAHISTACVGCGQCSRACPNQVPVAELFISIGRRTQAAFDYAPGRLLDEAPPLSIFRENEFEEVVGI